MKSSSKKFQKAGNIALIQLETMKGRGLSFIPAAVAIDKGELEIREIRQEGSVNTLLAINSSNSYCLLTDMDLLKGAKQNRVVNTSVLLAPNSKQEITVSCVERSRWSYDTPEFKSAPSVMDSKMRAAKAASLRSDKEDTVSETQSKIWDMINQEMTEQNVFSSTEDYNRILESKKCMLDPRYHFTHEKDCNGLAIFEDRRLVSFDIFGNREVYKYYFDKLTGDALGRIRPGKEKEALEQAEAFYRLDEQLDIFEAKLGDPVEQNVGALGKFRWSGDPEQPGFALSFQNLLVHMAGFEG
jgi:hypothetical protein